MNEMNNGENNNQNIEQQNMNKNNAVEPMGQQQYVQPVQEQPVSEPPKKSNALVIVLLLLVIGLAGFIVYDKMIKKEDVKEPEKQEEVQKKEDENTSNNSEEEPSNELNEQLYATNILKSKKSLNGEKYFKVTSASKKIDDKIVNLALAFYNVLGSTKEEDAVYYDIYINGERGWRELLATHFAASGCYDDCGNYRSLYDLYDENGKLIADSKYSEDIEYKIAEIDGTTIDSLFKVIKDTNSDVHYLISFDIGIGFALIDASGRITTNERQDTGRYTVVFDNIKNCTKTYQDSVNPTIFESDVIYYLAAPNLEDNDGKVNEYKITIDNGNVNKKLIKTCDADLAGAAWD